MKKRKQNEIISVILFKPETTHAPRVIKTAENIHAFCNLIGCRGAEVYGRQVGGKYYLFFCDEIGRYKGLRVSAMNEEGGIMFVGNLVITGMTKNGDVISLTDEDVERIQSNIVRTKTAQILHCEY